LASDPRKTRPGGAGPRSHVAIPYATASGSLDRRAARPRWRAVRARPRSRDRLHGQSRGRQMRGAPAHRGGRRPRATFRFLARSQSHRTEPSQSSKRACARRKNAQSMSARKESANSSTSSNGPSVPTSRQCRLRSDLTEFRQSARCPTPAAVRCQGGRLGLGGVARRGGAARDATASAPERGPIDRCRVLKLSGGMLRLISGTSRPVGELRQEGQDQPAAGLRAGSYSSGGCVSALAHPRPGPDTVRRRRRRCPRRARGEAAPRLSTAPPLPG
jgi:hypothetical protein